MWITACGAAVRHGSRSQGRPCGVDHRLGVEQPFGLDPVFEGRPFGMDHGPGAALRHGSRARMRPSGMNRGPTRGPSASIAARVRPLLYGSLARRRSLSAWIVGSEGGHFGADRGGGGSP